MPSGAAALSDNARKHTARNPLQRWLIKRFYATLLGLFDGLEIDSVLDAGCGEGFTLQRLAQRFAAPQLTATDADFSALGARSVCPPGVARVCADITALPYRDASFDAVLATEVLEHLAAPHAALREMQRVARRYVICSVPHEPYFRLANLLRGKNVAAGGNDPGHIQHWSRRGFRRFVDAQLPVRRCASAFPWTLILAETARHPTG